MAANKASPAAFQAGEPMLQVHDLRTSILKPASFSLSAGECIAVRGPSGAGKTLLLRAIADLDPNEGLVTQNGRDRSTIAGPEWRPLVGYVPAEPGWWADTGGDHLGEWTAALAGRGRTGPGGGPRVDSYIGIYILDKSAIKPHIQGATRKSPRCQPNSKTRSSLTRTPLARRLKLCVGRMVRSVHTAAQLSVSF